MTRETITRRDAVPDYQDQRSYQAFYLSEYERWGKYIRSAKITLDQ